MGGGGMGGGGMGGGGMGGGMNGMPQQGMGMPQQGMGMPQQGMGMPQQGMGMGMQGGMGMGMPPQQQARAPPPPRLAASHPLCTLHHPRLTRSFVCCADGWDGHAAATDGRYGDGDDAAANDGRRQHGHGRTDADSVGRASQAGSVRKPRGLRRPREAATTRWPSHS
jgi:hypothetical protein